eukprot:13254753-Heterocapsa_arctica.AAC.1
MARTQQPTAPRPNKTLLYIWDMPRFSRRYRPTTGLDTHYQRRPHSRTQRRGGNSDMCGTDHHQGLTNLHGTP